MSKRQARINTVIRLTVFTCDSTGNLDRHPDFHENLRIHLENVNFTAVSPDNCLYINSVLD